MISKLPSFPTEESPIGTGEKKKLLLEVGKAELRALDFLRSRYYSGLNPTAADVAEMVFQAALANPAQLMRLIDTDLHYASAEAMPLRDLALSKISNDPLYAFDALLQK